MKDWKTDLLGWAMTAIVVFAACASCSSCIGGERAYDSIQNQRMRQIEGRLTDVEKKTIEHESWLRSLNSKLDGEPRGRGTGDVEYPDPLFPPARPKVADVEDNGAGHFSVTDEDTLRIPAPARKMEPIPEPTVSTRRVQTGWLHTWAWSYGWYPGTFGPRLGWGWCKTTTPIYEDRPNSHYYYPRAR
uniref:Uncharacterized protein n=1 Tax=viral metagenome TaxID=1070528 RepID=A0A6M3K5X0_9ZZZZ